jgi:hypothetical protein
VHGGELGHRTTGGHVDPDLAGVRLGGQLGQLGAVGADPQVRVAHPAGGVLGNCATSGGDAAVGDVVRQPREGFRGVPHVVHHDLEWTAHGGRAHGEVEGLDDALRAVAEEAVGVLRARPPR